MPNTTSQNSPLQCYMNYTIQEPIFGNYIIQNIQTNSNIFTRDQIYSKVFVREQENSKILTRDQKYLKIFLYNQSMTTIETIVSSTNNDNTSGDISKNPLAYSLLQALVIVIFIYFITIAICCIAIQRYKKRLYKNHLNISYDAQYNNNSGCY